MIAPLRENRDVVTAPRPKAGLLRAHRWIAETLIDNRATTRAARRTSIRMWSATGWIVLVAVAYFGHLIVAFLAAR